MQLTKRSDRPVWMASLCCEKLSCYPSLLVRLSVIATLVVLPNSKVNLAHLDFLINLFITLLSVGLRQLMDESI